MFSHLSWHMYYLDDVTSATRSIDGFYLNITEKLCMIYGRVAAFSENPCRNLRVRHETKWSVHTNNNNNSNTELCKHSCVTLDILLNTHWAKYTYLLFFRIWFITYPFWPVINNNRIFICYLSDILDIYALLAKLINVYISLIYLMLYPCIFIP